MVKSRCPGSSCPSFCQASRLLVFLRVHSPTLFWYDNQFLAVKALSCRWDPNDTAAAARQPPSTIGPRLKSQSNTMYQGNACSRRGVWASAGQAAAEGTRTLNGQSTRSSTRTKHEQRLLQQHSLLAQ